MTTSSHMHASSILTKSTTAVGCAIILCHFVISGSSFLGTASRLHILNEVENVFGKHIVKNRVPKLETLLEPLYQALPKTDRGGLGHASVRYALHRFFAQQHGWLVHGLEPNGGSYNETSPTSLLKGHVPASLQAGFEKHLHGRGFQLRELALLTASVENLVRAETIRRIETIYDILKFKTNSLLSQQEAIQILDTNFMVYIFETGIADVEALVQKVTGHMDKFYPGWEDTQAFLRDTQGNVDYAERDLKNPFVPQTMDFRQVLHIAEEAHDKYGQFQDMECQQLKSILLAYEHKGTGRISMSDFYGLALGGDWRFRESQDYLRQLGALDESDPEHPSLIVANYMYGKSMCLASSAFYSVCCVDECNKLLGDLEDIFATPTVNPDRLAEAVALMPSSTVAAPRNLSGALLQRLDDIAAQHSGVVPLHGRLFHQFMHHAFPRECAFPHVSGTTNPVVSSAWEKQTGSSWSVSVEEVNRRGKNHADDADGEEPWDAQVDGETWDEPLPWKDEEELFTNVALDSSGDGSQWLRSLAMFSAIAVVLVGLGQKVHTVICSESAGVGKKGSSFAV